MIDDLETLSVATAGPAPAGDIVATVTPPGVRCM
jgi:hypothetical protein